MKQFQRIASLFLISSLLLQVSVSAQDTDKKMTVTIVNQHTTETLVGFEKTSVDVASETISAINLQKVDSNPEEQKPKDDKPKDDTKEADKPKDDASKKDDKPKDDKPTDDKPKDGDKPKDDKPEDADKPQDEQELKLASVDQKSNQQKDEKVSQSGATPANKDPKADYRKNDIQVDEQEMSEPSEEHPEEQDRFMGEDMDEYMGESREAQPDNNTPEEEESSTTPEEKSTSEEKSKPEEKTTPEEKSAPEEDISANTANKTAPATPTGPHAPVAQVTGCKTQGQIALTYSEGPSDVTAKIVRQLTKADARANFFVNATWLYTQQYAMVAQNIYNAGHFIGMTYRVKNDNPDALTDEQIRQDIISNAHTIESIINVAPKYVRLHYTEKKDVRTEGILQELGFVIVGYNLDSLDYFKKDATGPGSSNQIYEDTFIKYKDTYDAKGSFISIQYDLPYTGSLAAIPHVINTIQQEGYTMVRLDGCLNDATPYKKSANSTEYVSDKFSFGQSKYHQGQKAIVIETPEEAKVADEQFNMQSIESMTSMANSQQISVPFFLFAVGVIFTLYL